MRGQVTIAKGARLDDRVTVNRGSPAVAERWLAEPIPGSTAPRAPPRATAPANASNQGPCDQLTAPTGHRYDSADTRLQNCRANAGRKHSSRSHGASNARSDAIRRHVTRISGVIRSIAGVRAFHRVRPRAPRGDTAKLAPPAPRCAQEAARCCRT